MSRISKCLDDETCEVKHENIKQEKRSAFRLVLRLASWCFLIATSVAILLIIVAATVLFSGFNSDFLREQAKVQLQTILGETSEVNIGSTHIRLTPKLELSVEARDVFIDAVDQGVRVEHINSLTLGVSPIALLKGQFNLSTFELNDAEIIISETEGKTHLADILPLDEYGRADFDKASDRIFHILDEVFESLANKLTNEIVLNNSKIKFKLFGKEQEVIIDTASLAERNEKTVIRGNVVWDEQIIEVVGEAELNYQSVQSFDLQMLKIPLNIKSAPGVKRLIGKEKRVNPAYFELLTTTDIKLSGNRGHDSEKQKLMIEVNARDVNLDIGRINDTDGELNLLLDYVSGTQKLEIQPSDLRLGGLSLNFNGAFGLNSAPQTDYRFELITESAVSLPSNSTEPALDFGLKIAGHYNQEANRIQFSNLDVKTANGEIYGQGTVGLGIGSPELIFMLRIPEMPVSSAKHLWPIDVADGAREWVLKNLFGGTLFDSNIDVSIPAGFFNGPGLPPPLTENEIKADFKVRNTRFDVVGDIPAVRDADGEVSVRGAHTTIKLAQGTAYTADNREVHVSNGTLIIPWGPQRPVIAQLDMDINGRADAIAELLAKKPINISHKLPFKPEEISGEVSADVKIDFSVTKNAPKDSLKWQADIKFKDVDLAVPVSNQTIKAGNGEILVSQNSAKITAQATLNDIPAKISLIEPIEDSSIKKSQNIQLILDDKIRDTLFPAAHDILSGTVTVNLGDDIANKRHVTADLTKAQLNLPWLGWRKGQGVKSQLSFDLVTDPKNKSHYSIQNLSLTGDGFQIKGGFELNEKGLVSAKFPLVQLTRNDNLSLSVALTDRGYKLTVSGKRFDARALIQKMVSAETEAKTRSGSSDALGSARIVINGQVGEVEGFYGETFRNLTLSYESEGKKISSASAQAKTRSGKTLTATHSEQPAMRSISAQSGDAGALLRFLNFYDKVDGGTIRLDLAGQKGKPLIGQIGARNFSIVDEPKLSSIVSSSPSKGAKSLNQSISKKIDTARVEIDRGFVAIEKGADYVNLSKGIIRGPVVGATFQGTINDKSGLMTITGTFMPAYGLNSMFGSIPVIGAILGNGREGGLIGITYKITGSIKNPKVMVNPISVVAPGIFRSIFEY